MSLACLPCTMLSIERNCGAATTSKAFSGWEAHPCSVQVFEIVCCRLMKDIVNSAINTQEQVNRQNMQQENVTKITDIRIVSMSVLILATEYVMWVYFLHSTTCT